MTNYSHIIREPCGCIRESTTLALLDTCWKHSPEREALEKTVERHFLHLVRRGRKPNPSMAEDAAAKIAQIVADYAVALDAVAIQGLHAWIDWARWDPNVTDQWLEEKD